VLAEANAEAQKTLAAARARLEETLKAERAKLDAQTREVAATAARRILGREASL
jgi:F0F1-type ATP synthase membrane subunit b/b'